MELLILFAMVKFWYVHFRESEEAPFFHIVFVCPCVDARLSRFVQLLKVFLSIDDTISYLISNIILFICSDINKSQMFYLFWNIKLWCFHSLCFFNIITFYLLYCYIYLVVNNLIFFLTLIWWTPVAFHCIICCFFTTGLF